MKMNFKILIKKRNLLNFYILINFFFLLNITCIFYTINSYYLMVYKMSSRKLICNLIKLPIHYIRKEIIIQKNEPLS